MRDMNYKKSYCFVIAAWQMLLKGCGHAEWFHEQQSLEVPKKDWFLSDIVWWHTHCACVHVCVWERDCGTSGVKPETRKYQNQRNQFWETRLTDSTDLSRSVHMTISADLVIRVFAWTLLPLHCASHSTHEPVFSHHSPPLYFLLSICGKEDRKWEKTTVIDFYWLKKKLL